MDDKQDGESQQYVDRATGYHALRTRRGDFRWPKEPTDSISAMATANVGFQMQWSVEHLEGELAREGRFVVGSEVVAGLCAPVAYRPLPTWHAGGRVCGVMSDGGVFECRVYVPSTEGARGEPMAYGV